MKKASLILFCLSIVMLLFGNKIHAQTPDNLSTDIVSGTLTSYTMTNLGKFNQTRLLSTTTQPASTSRWEFYSCSGSCYTYSWAPNSPGLTLAGYNQDIPPAAGTASATYNSGSTGQYGLLPAVTSGNYYTFNVMNTTGNNDMGVLQTTYSPVSITSVSAYAACASSGVTVSAKTSIAPNPAEYLYIRYTTNLFSTTTVAKMTGSGTTWTAAIPNQSAGTVVDYYVFSSPNSSLTTTGMTDAYYYTQTLNMNVNGAVGYYIYTFGALSGTYTVNTTSTASFSSLAAALGELNIRGTTGSVTINIPAGYTETAPVGGYLLQYCSALPVANQNNAGQTITIQKSGAGADPLLLAQVGTSASSDAIFTINGDDYITINGIDLKDGNTSNFTTEMEAGYAILQQSTTNGADNNIIENCSVTLYVGYDATSNTTNFGPMAIMMDDVTYGNYTTSILPSSTANASNNNSFYSNTTLNCATGISINQIVSNPSNFGQGNTVGASALGNTIQNFGSSAGSAIYSYGIYAAYQNNISVAYNTINNTASGGTPAVCNMQGIYIGGSSDGQVTINNNTISLSMSLTFLNNYGQQVMCICSYGTSSLITNNTIQNCNIASGGYGPFYGIFNGGIATSLTISGNIIGTAANPNTINTTNGAIDFIVNQKPSPADIINITGNTIQYNSVLPTSNSYVEFIANQGSCTTLTVTGNSINNNTVTATSNTSVIWGFLNMGAVSGTLTLGATGSGNGNIIQNNALNTIGYLYFFDPTDLGTVSIGTESIVNNTILTNTNSSASTRPVYLFYNNTATNNITFSSNIMGNNSSLAYTESGACTGNFYGYSNIGNISPAAQPSGGTESITNNTLSVTLKTSGISEGIYSNTASLQTGIITGNTISNFTNSGTGTFLGFDFESHSTTSTFYSNAVSGVNSLATTGGGNIYGFYLLAPIQNIYSNTFTGMTLTATSNANLYPLYISNTPTSPSSVYSNMISSITSSGTNLINAVSVSETVNTCNIYSNLINAISGNAAQVMGISLNNNTATTANCYQNNIYNCSSTNAAALIAGIDAVAGTANNVYNNVISDLRATAATNNSTLSIRGLEIDGGTNAGFYYNTVYLNAVSSGTNFGTAALFLNNTTTALTLQNNILANASTSKGTQASVSLQTIYALSAGVAPNVSAYISASSNNAFYTPASGYIYADNLPIASANNKYQFTCSNISLFQSYITPRENNSFYELPPFINVSSTPYNLQLNSATATACYQGGIPVNSPSITVDNLGSTRSSTAPTVGAYELVSGTVADKTAPVINITSAVPNCNNNVTFTASITDAGTGVNTTTSLPRVYYKLSTENNVLLGNTSASNGWKYAQASNASSPFSFTIDLTLLSASVTSGSIIQYFVVAQDKAATPNISVSGASLVSCVTSVSLGAANFPAAGISNSFTIPAFPQGAAITPASATVCQGGIQSLIASVSNPSTPNVTWSPVASLYTDAAATMPYNALSNYATVYTNTNASTSYIATISFGACSTTVTVPVTTGPNNWTGNSSTDWNVAANWCSNAVPSAITNVVIPSSATRMPVIGISGSNALCSNITIQSGATLTMQSGYSLTISSTGIFSNSGTFTEGSTSEAVIFAGSGFISGTTATTFNNITINGAVTMNNNVTVNSITTINAGGTIIINGKTINLIGTLAGTGSFTGDNAAVMNIKGTLSTSLGTLYFTSGSQLLNTISMDRWNSTVIGNGVTLGSGLSVNNLSLVHGVISTGTNLLTLTSYSGLTTPGGIPWASNQNNNYALSYIATCDSTGTPINVSGPSTPLTGNYGFQINNIGTGGTTGTVYYPIGATYLPAGTDPSFIPTPNRMSIINTGSADNFNVVVTYGDIGGTPQPKINRIWYINSTKNTDQVTMQLFFVERNTANWPNIENEVENATAPFDYTNIILVEKDYSANQNYIAVTSNPGSDVQNFPFGTYGGKEVYAQYSIGNSTDAGGNANGLYQFNRFSITNPGGIILPLNIINFTAIQQGNTVKTSWISKNEVNVNHYELQRSLNGIDFTTINNISALNNGLPSINYESIDKNPLQNNNYYRIKVVYNNLTITYTNTVLVDMNNASESIAIFPNPVINNSFTLQLNDLPTGTYLMEIYNTLGQSVLSSPIVNQGRESTTETIKVPFGIGKGEYFLKLTGATLLINKTIIFQ